MKLNRSFFINTALTITLLTSATISANASEVTKYAKDNSSESHGQVTRSLAANSYGEDNSAESSDDRFIAQVEIALAILIIIVGLVASAIYERNQEQQQLAKGEKSEKNSVKIEDKLENQDLPRVSS